MRETFAAGLQQAMWRCATALAVASGAGELLAANVTWNSSATFDTGNLNLGGTVVYAVNFGTTSQTVTIGGDTATFVASTTLSPPNMGFPSANDGAAGNATFVNVAGNQPLINVLASHAFNGPEDVQTITLTSLIAGQNYEVQAFMFDSRATGDPVLNTAQYHLTDGNGNNSGLSSRGSGTIHVGTFTANASTQNILVVSDPSTPNPNNLYADPALSGLVLRALTGGVVTAAINRSTGQLTITNGTANPLDISGYSVTSAYGALSQTNWLSVANNYDRPSAPTPGNGSIDANDAWTIHLGTGVVANLSESELSGGNGGAIPAGGTLNLGNVWVKSPTEDVQVSLLRGDGSVFPVPLTFSGNGGVPFKRSDLNFDGNITAADWSIYIAGAHTNMSALSAVQAYQMGDLNGDKMNNINDLDLFIEDYDMANGGGAFQAMLAGVPEPSAVALAAVAACALAARRRRVAARWTVALAALAACLTATPVQAQLTLNPIATTGYDEDIIFETGLADGAVGATGELGSRQYFEEGALSGTEGLPRTIPPYLAASGNTINFTFQPFEQNNILKFTNGTAAKSLTLDAPMAYSTLAIVHSGGSIGTNTEYGLLSYQINYAGGATQTGVINSPDWGAVTTLPPGTERLVIADRTTANATTWPVTSDNNTTANRWAIYVSEITLTNTSATVESITFGPNELFTIATQTAGPLNSGDDIVVFGIAGPGEVVPTALDLRVNQRTGQINITNPTAAAIEINGYEITGGGTSLNVAGWNSLSDQNIDAIDGPDADSIVGNGVGETWDEAAGSSNAALMEGFLLGSSSIAPGGSLSLGTPYNATLDIEDLVFKVRRTTGVVSTGTVSYVNTLPADFEPDGDVDATDLQTWKTGYGPAATATTGDADGDGDADGADFLLWQRFLGATPAAPVQAAVPEPMGAALALVGCVGLAVSGRRQVRGSARRHQTVRASLACAAAMACLTAADVSRATVFVDREYRFGDDPSEGAIENNFVITTFDSAGNGVGTNTLHDLAGVVPPLYADVGPTGLNRPGAAANSLGVTFSGVEYLSGARLGFPGTSASSTGAVPPGPLDFTGLYNRGFQLWVRPGTQTTPALQDVVADANQHGVRISQTGFWVQRYNGADFTTTAPATPNAWAHVMVVRPYGLVPPNGGSILYVNGVAVGAQAGGYNAADNVSLVVGANTGATPGTANFFTGVVDQMTMFVMGRTLNGLDRGTFSFRTDNAFAAQPVGMGGLTANPADVNQDGSLTPADVNDFVAGWLKEKRVNGVRVGDMTTIRNGDLNFDGITDLADAHLLNQALLVATGQGLDYGLLGVPEPSSLGLGVLATMIIGGRCRRTRRTASR